MRTFLQKFVVYFARLREGLMGVVGIWSYENYELQSRRLNRTPMSREAFFRECLQRRMGSGKSCC